jgi:hypothetical protein
MDYATDGETDSSLLIERGRQVIAGYLISPDSAVSADAMSEEQTFRSEVNGSLPLNGHRSSVVQDEI